MDDSFIERESRKRQQRERVQDEFPLETCKPASEHSPAFDNDFPDEEMREKLEKGSRIFAEGADWSSAWLPPGV